MWKNVFAELKKYKTIMKYIMKINIVKISGENVG